MLVSCGKCGKLHPRGYKCNIGRVYKQTEERKARSSNKWKLKAKQIKEDAFNLCEVCKDKGLYNYEGLEVHHIIKIKEDPGGLLDDNNLICLCVEHHKQADAGELDADYLRELAKKRQSIFTGI